MAMIVHAVMNISSQIWYAIPEYSGGTLSPGPSLAQRTFENPLLAKFAAFLFHALGRIRQEKGPRPLQIHRRFIAVIRMN